MDRKKDKGSRAGLLGFVVALAVGFGGMIAWIQTTSPIPLWNRIIGTETVSVDVNVIPPPEAERPPQPPPQAAQPQPAQPAPVPAAPAPAAPAPAASPPSAPAAQTVATVQPPPQPAPAPPPPVVQAPQAPRQFTAGGMVVAPAPGLVEDSPIGPLPRVGRDPVNDQPWRVYRRPFDQGSFEPKVAMIVAGLGISQRATDAAIDRLPASVTLAFDPAGRRSANPADRERFQAMVDRARRDGHEVLLMLPLEPAGYPRFDPGPNTLLTSLTPAENRRRLEANLAAFVGYVGVVSLSGSRFSTAPDRVDPIMEVLRQRGLMYVDAHVASDPLGAGDGQRTLATRVASADGRIRAVPGSPPVLAVERGVPLSIVDRWIDEPAVSGLIDAELSALERAATANGAAVGVGLVSNQITLDRVAAWAVGLESRRGVVLAPVTATVVRASGR